MSKQLLKENTVRRFMKLASIPSLSDNFVRENYADPAGAREDEEELPPEDLEAEAPPADLEGEPGPEMPGAEDEMGLDDMPDEELPDDEMGDEMGDGLEGDMSLSREEAEVLIDLGKRLEQVMAGELDLDDDDALGAPEEDPLDAPEEEPMDAAPEDAAPEDSAPLGDEEEDEEEEPLEEGRRRQMIVNEVLKRVTKRILKAKSRK